MKTDDPHIQRRVDGSIDLDYYERIARRFRARDQRNAASWLVAPLAHLLRVFHLQRRPARPPNRQRQWGASSLPVEAEEMTKASVRRVIVAWCITALLAALALSVPAAPAKAGGVDPQLPVIEVPLPVMVAAMTGWVAAELGEPIPEELPAIVFVDRATMRALARSDGMLPTSVPGTDNEVQALYRFDSRTIFLPAGWSGATAAELSVLVHEIVHHFQALRGDTHACPAAREQLAYDVQARWLEAQGESLESALGIEPLFLIFATNCLF